MSSSAASDEEFIRSYNSGGLAGAYYASIVVATVYSIFVASSLVGENFPPLELIARGCVIICMVAIAVFIRFYPELAIVRYQGLVALASGAVLIVTIWLTVVGDMSAKFSPLGAASTLIFGLFLHYAFLRLTVVRSVLVGVTASVVFLVFFGADGQGGESHGRVSVYLIASNFAGFLLRKSAFSRERALFRMRARARQAEALASQRALKAEAEFVERVRLLNAIDHDLRQPLFAADVCRRSIENGLVAGNSVEIERGVSELRGVLDLVRRTLDHIRGISSIDRAEGGLVCEAFPVSQVAGSLRAVLEAEAVRRGVQFTWKSIEGDYPILSNAGAVSQVLLNLGVNAIKFSGGRGMDPVAGCDFRIRRGALLVRFWDNGAGIAKVDRDVIWAAYGRGRAMQNASESGGVGLGLFLVRRMIDAMPLHLVSFISGARRGTIFRVIIPLAPIPPFAGREEEKSSVGMHGAYVIAIAKSNDELFHNIMRECELLGVLVDIYPSIDAVSREFLEDRSLDLLVVAEEACGVREIGAFLSEARDGQGWSPFLLAPSRFESVACDNAFQEVQSQPSLEELRVAIEAASVRARSFEADSR